MMLHNKHFHRHHKDLSSAIAIGFSLLAFIANFLFNLLLSRNLTAAVYGDIYIVIQLLVLCSILGVWGTNTTIVRFLPKYLAGHEHDKLLGYLSWNKTLVFRATLVLSLLGGLFAAGAFILDKFHITSIDKMHPFIFAFWLIPLYIVSLITNSTLQGLQRVNLAMFLSNVGFVLLGIVELGLFVLVFKKVNIYQLLLLLGVSQSLIILIQFKLIKQKLYQIVTTENLQYEIPKWQQYSRSMLANNVVMYISNIVVVMVLELIGKHEAEVGIFAAITTVASIFYTVSGAINTLVSPQLSANENNPSKLQEITSKANLSRILITTPIILIVVFFAKDILVMFNPLFATYTLALNITTISTYLFIFFSIAASLLTYGGAEKLELYSTITFLLSSLLFSFILIPKFQLIGAIWAQVISLTIAYLFDFIACKKVLKVKTLFFI